MCGETEEVKGWLWMWQSDTSKEGVYQIDK